jgi:hypothetical protein
LLLFFKKEDLSIACLPSPDCPAFFFEKKKQKTFVRCRGFQKRTFLKHFRPAETLFMDIELKLG